jgi:hypothetical protein
MQMAMAQTPTMSRDVLSESNERTPHNPSGWGDHIAQALLFCVVLGYFGGTTWLSWMVPVSDQDLLHASFILPQIWPQAGYQIQNWPSVGFVAGALGVGLSTTCLVIGGAMGVARNSPLPILQGVVAAIILQLGCLGTAHNFRIWAMTGNAKIGCYDWQAKDCRELLREPAHIASFEGTTVYKSRAAITGNTRNPVTQFAHYLLHPAELDAVLQEQRAQVARFQASKGALH